VSTIQKLAQIIKKKNQKQVTKNVRFNYHQTLKMHLSKTITFKKCYESNLQIITRQSVIIFTFYMYTF